VDGQDDLGPGQRVTATWTIRIGLLVEAGLRLVLATSRSAYLVGAMLFAFGVHGALWTIVGSSLRQRLTPPEMMGPVASTGLFIAAGGNCVGAVLGGVIAARFGITAPYWAGFVVAALVSAAVWDLLTRLLEGPDGEPVLAGPGAHTRHYSPVFRPRAVPPGGPRSSGAREDDPRGNAERSRTCSTPC
jgi:MFS family permease